MEKLSKNLGLSTIEVILMMAILALISVPLGIFLVNFFSYNRQASERIQIEGQIRGSLDKMIDELRKMQTSDAGAYPLESAGPQSLTFYSDLDNDGKRERVRYFLDGEILRKGIIKSAGFPPTYSSTSETFEVLATGVKNGSSALFAYYDSNYAGSGPPLDFPVSLNAVRLIKIYLTLGVSSSRPEEFINLSSAVTLRNLRDN